MYFFFVLEKHFSVGSQFALAFEMRPQRLTGLLFHVQNRKTSLAVFINETKVKQEWTMTAARAAG